MARKAKPRGVKVRAANVAVPQGRDEANALIARIGTLRRELDRIAADMNDELARIKEQHELRAEPLKAEAETAVEGLKIWCEANRAGLTQGGKVKSAAFPAGEVRWRARPPRVTVRGADAVIEALERLGLTKFVRLKREVNKEAILDAPGEVAGIAGITIGSEGEDFTVEPFAGDLEAGRP